MYGWSFGRSASIDVRNESEVSAYTTERAARRPASISVSDGRAVDSMTSRRRMRPVREMITTGRYSAGRVTPRPR